MPQWRYIKVKFTRHHRSENSLRLNPRTDLVLGQIKKKTFFNDSEALTDLGSLIVEVAR